MRLSQHSSWKRSALMLFSATLLASLVPEVAFAQSTSSPTITGYTSGTNASTLVIDGNNFGTAAATVSLNNNDLSVINWSPTQITVSLPVTAGPGGTLDVTTTSGQTATDSFAGVERGYYTLTSSGVVKATNGLKTYGDLTTVNAPSTSRAIGLVPTPDDQGYWILTQQGSVYSFGDAATFTPLPSPVDAVAMAALPSGQGAYILAQDGTVYALGQAQNYGNAPSGIMAQSIAVTPDGQGYWILAANGQVYAFGDAQSLGAVTLPSQQVSFPNGTLVQVANTTPVFMVEGSTLYHIPNPEVLAGLGDTIGNVKEVSSLTGYSLGLPMVLPYTGGTIVQDSATHTAYVAQSGVLHPLSNTLAQSLNPKDGTWVEVSTLKANWPVGAALTSMAQYVPEGSLYRVKNTDPVYIMHDGKLQQIASPAVFYGMGLQWSEVHVVSSLPSGIAVGSPIDTPVPILTSGSLWTQAHGNGWVYVAENGSLRHIPTAATFNTLGFQWSQIHTLSSLNNIPVSSPLASTSIPSGSSSVKAVSLAVSPTGQGYWVLLSNGNVETRGAVSSFGQLSPSQLGRSQAVQMVPTPDGGGYTILTSQGQSFAFGDALTAASAAGIISLAPSAAPSASTGLFSMAYGSFMPGYDGSYSTLVNDGPALSAIIPTWFYESQNPSTLAWNLGTPEPGVSQTQAVVNLAHQEGVQVWPMIGSTSIGPYDPANAAQTVSQIVQAVKTYGYNGITIDFEPSIPSGVSLDTVEQNYTAFIAQLGPALRSIGAGLMVDSYPSDYPYSPYNWAKLAPYVTYINIMTYGHFDYTTEAGDDANLSWMQGIYQAAVADGVSPGQLIVGLGPYGDYWSFNNSGMDTNAPLGDDGYVSDGQVAQLLQSNLSIHPVWDSASQSEIFMTNEYVNNQGQWTVNPSGQAVAPTQTLSTADEPTFLPQVQNLQGLLNYILVRYADENHQPVPSFLKLTQDGHYGPITKAAVIAFQNDFNVSGATPGVYDAATRAALSQVINNWNIGEYQYWVDNTQAMQARISQIVLADHLGGTAIWRLPFETSRFWPMLQSLSPIAHGLSLP